MVWRHGGEIFVDFRRYGAMLCLHGPKSVYIVWRHGGEIFVDYRRYGDMFCFHVPKAIDTGKNSVSKMWSHVLSPCPQIYRYREKFCIYIYIYIYSEIVLLSLKVSLSRMKVCPLLIFNTQILSYYTVSCQISVQFVR